MNDRGKALRRDTLRNGVVRAGAREDEHVSGKDVRAAAEAIVMLLHRRLVFIGSWRGDPVR